MSAIAVAAALTAIVGVSQAQDSSPPRLSLERALSIAADQNLDLIAARRRRAVAQAGIRIARERPNPTANFSALRDEPHESFFFDQTIELGGKRRHRIEVAQQESALTDVDIAALERQVRRSAREAYYALAAARANLLRLAEVVKLTERLHDIARQRFEAGAIAQLEVIQAELELSRARAEQSVAVQEEKIARSRLNALLNRPVPSEWELEGSLADVLPSQQLEGLVERAYASSPEIARLAQEQKAEQSRMAVAKAGRVPNLDLQFGADFNSPRDFEVGPRGQVSVGVPLFYRNQGEIAQSLANQRLLEGELAAARRAVAGRVEEAYFELAARQGQAEAYRKSLLPTALSLESLAEESYRAGKAPILTVIDAQRNVQEVERTYQESQLGVQDAFAALEETVGAPLN